MKKIVIIKIEVDLDTDSAKEWKYAKQYVSAEVEDVFDEILSGRFLEKPKEVGSEGETDNGTTFEIELKNKK